MFIQTQSTPNPATLKFIPGKDVSPGCIYDFTDRESAATSPLAASLFGLNGIDGVFLGDDFVAVSKSDAADWAHLKPQVLAAIMDHYLSGVPVVDDAPASSPGAEPATYEGEAAEIVEEIKQLIDARVRPAVAQDGGDIEFHRFDVDTGVVELVMRGACSGCPSSTMTLKQGVENLLKHYVPEVTAVEAVI